MPPLAAHALARPRGADASPPAGHPCARTAALGLLAVSAVLVATAPPAWAGAPACIGHVQYYGTYSIGRKAGQTQVPLVQRLRELSALGANMVVATGAGTEILALLPPGMLAVPGCGLMKREDWQTDGRWDEARARARLAKLAAAFADHPRVLGVCLTHEVTEYADHERRHWMYRLAKEYFPRTQVIQYYGHLYDRENPRRERVHGYGLRGERETDILFLSLPATDDGRFAPENVRRLDDALAAAEHTPGVPVWGQTSINADHRYVTGPESMRATWGARGENMKRWGELLLRRTHRDRSGRTLGLSGFFWRSLGRFPFDLGHPAFADHRARVHAISKELCLDHERHRTS